MDAQDGIICNSPVDTIKPCLLAGVAQVVGVASPDMPMMKAEGQNQVRMYTQLVGSIPNWGKYRRQPINVYLSLSLKQTKKFVLYKTKIYLEKVKPSIMKNRHQY